MTATLRDLVSLTKASEKMKVDVTDLLFDAHDGKLKLFALSTREYSLDLIPCNKAWIEEGGFFTDIYGGNTATHIEVEVGQVLALSTAAIKGLIVNKQFSEVELFRNLGPDLTGTGFEYWRTAEELYEHHKWIDGKADYEPVGLDRIYILKSEMYDSTKPAQAQTSTSLAASNTSLKVIGLLMHHLAKSPKYASGTSPNKSQIKELLLELAVELNVNNYGLSKVDERLLADAMKYLETQKN